MAELSDSLNMARQELEAEGADYLAETPAELIKVVLGDG